MPMQELLKVQSTKNVLVSGPPALTSKQMDFEEFLNAHVATVQLTTKFALCKKTVTLR
jgi:hypothetical protein